MLVLVALGACSGGSSGNDAPNAERQGSPTAESLASKLRDADVCVFRAQTVPDAPLPHAWGCGTRYGVAIIWAFPSAAAVTNARSFLTGRACKLDADRRQAAGTSNPDADRAVPVAYAVGDRWLVAFDNDEGPGPAFVAKALHGHVVDDLECGAVDNQTM